MHAAALCAQAPLNFDDLAGATGPDQGSPRGDLDQTPPRTPRLAVGCPLVVQPRGAGDELMLNMPLKALLLL